MTTNELAFMGDFENEFPKVVQVINQEKYAKEILLNQSALAANLSSDGLLFLGKLIKYLGLRNIEIIIAVDSKGG